MAYFASDFGFVPLPEKEWSGYPDPRDPDNFWIDNETGERVCAKTGKRTETAKSRRIRESKKTWLELYDGDK